MTMATAKWRRQNGNGKMATAKWQWQNGNSDGDSNIDTNSKQWQHQVAALVKETTTASIATSYNNGKRCNNHPAVRNDEAT